MKAHKLAVTILLGMAMPKGSPLLDPLNLALLKLRGDGVLEDLRDKWHGEECTNEVNNIIVTTF